MRQKTVLYFTDGEEELARRLVRVGARPNVARILVYLARNAVATAVEIERGSGMRQPDVSAALKYPLQLGWIKTGRTLSSKSGRTVNEYALAKPITEIMGAIESEKRKNNVNGQLAFVRKLRGLSSVCAFPANARAS
jgi:predicted transcriptional regulator